MEKKYGEFYMSSNRMETEFVNKIIRILLADLYWIFICIKENIDKRDVVLVLMGENKKVDELSLEYLDLFRKRRHARKAVVFVAQSETEKWKNKSGASESIKIRGIKKKYILLLYERYCMNKFFKNLVFTSVNTTKENMIDRYLKESNITEEDVVCLAFYNFRGIPQRNEIK